MCTNACEYASLALNGRCDDGGPDSESGLCTFGTDCSDCGTRFDTPTIIDAIDDRPPSSPEFEYAPFSILGLNGVYVGGAAAGVVGALLLMAVSKELCSDKGRGRARTGSVQLQDSIEMPALSSAHSEAQLGGDSPPVAMGQWVAPTI